MIDRRLQCFAGFAATLVGLFFRNGLAHAMRGRLVARAPLAVKCTSRRNGGSVHASFITVNVD